MDSVDAFRNTGQTADLQLYDMELSDKALRVRARFSGLGVSLGSAVGLLVGVILVFPSLRQLRTQNQPVILMLLELMFLPVFAGVGCLMGWGLAAPLARLHPTVRLAAYMPQGDQFSQKEVDKLLEKLKPRIDAVQAFRNTGKPAPELYAEAQGLIERIHWPGAGLGAWVGLVVGIKLCPCPCGDVVPITSLTRRTVFPADAVSGIALLSRCGKALLKLCPLFRQANQMKKKWLAPVRRRR